MTMRIGWTSDRLTMWQVFEAVRDRRDFEVVGFETHFALNLADLIEPFDVVVLRGQDALNAEQVAEALRRRSLRRAVALCSGCNCPGGLQVAHHVDPASFDAFFRKPIQPVLLLRWLEGLRRQ